MGAVVLEKDLRFEAFLDSVVIDRAREDAWLEMLSLLEYVGLRKIVRGVRWSDVDFRTLIHLSEEAQHAASLRALVPRRSWAENPWVPAGWKYFDRLDQELSQGLEPQVCYPLVSWSIERRVLYVYPTYLQRTQRASVRETLDRILAQERRHSEEAERSGLSEAHQNLGIEIEQSLWQNLLDDLEKPNPLL